MENNDTTANQPGAVQRMLSRLDGWVNTLTGLGGHRH